MINQSAAGYKAFSEKASVLLILMTISFSATAQCDNPIYSGDGTYYTLEEEGNCMLDARSVSPFYIAAMNASQYDQAALCGACAEVRGPQGNVIVRIVDQCPECEYGDIDMSPEAFEQIAEMEQGRVPVSWSIVPCNESGNIQLLFKEGSSQWWTAVQVRDHVNPIASLEYENSSGNFVELPRQDYNFFLASSGLGTGPYTFKITDIYDNKVVVRNIPLEIETELDGGEQFPLCNLTGMAEKKSAKQYVSIKTLDSGTILEVSKDALEVVVYNIQGKKLGMEDQGFSTVNPGLYFYVVTNKEGEVQSGKFQTGNRLKVSQ